VVDELKPANVEVVGAMAMVRNSVGANAYVSDEIVTSRAGVRIRVGNTDAEGRMAMADVLCKVTFYFLFLNSVISMNHFLFSVERGSCERR